MVTVNFALRPITRVGPTARVSSLRYGRWELNTVHS